MSAASCPEIFESHLRRDDTDNASARDLNACPSWAYDTRRRKGHPPGHLLMARPAILASCLGRWSWFQLLLRL